MSTNSRQQLPAHDSKGLEMYFSPKISKKFAKLEQNEKNFKVAQAVDRVLMHASEKMTAPLRAAELGGGAHPDRYHEFFSKLTLEPQGRMDWVDISPNMLELAKKYVAKDEYNSRKQILYFVESDIFKYLTDSEDGKLDIAIMKYTLNHIADLESLFGLLAKKLASGGKLVATIEQTSPELKCFSTNARYLYNGEEFPADETRTLKDGDNYTIKFLKVSGQPESGCLEGAETVKYYHSLQKIKQLASACDFEIFLDDWKKYVPAAKQFGETMDQDILVLTKK